MSFSTRCSHREDGMLIGGLLVVVLYLWCVELGGWSLSCLRVCVGDDVAVIVDRSVPKIVAHSRVSVVESLKASYSNTNATTHQPRIRKVE